eukprot:Hpha_TRINITY_DN7349_c0_g1::TRINITY_DN7349_c0_g1_i1::g.10032::m.10032
MLGAPLTGGSTPLTPRAFARRLQERQERQQAASVQTTSGSPNKDVSKRKSSSASATFPRSQTALTAVLSADAALTAAASKSSQSDKASIASSRIGSSTLGSTTGRKVTLLQPTPDAIMPLIVRNENSLWLVRTVQSKWTSYLPMSRYEPGSEVGVKRLTTGCDAQPRPATVMLTHRLSALSTDGKDPAVARTPPMKDLIDPLQQHAWDPPTLLPPSDPPSVIRLSYGAGTSLRDEWLSEFSPLLAGGRTPLPIPQAYQPGMRLAWVPALRVRKELPASLPATPAVMGTPIVFELQDAQGVVLNEGQLLLPPYSRWQVEDTTGVPPPYPGSVLVRLRALPSIIPAVPSSFGHPLRRRFVLVCDASGVLGQIHRRLFFAALPCLWHDDPDRAEELGEGALTRLAGTADGLGIFRKADDAFNWYTTQSEVLGGNLSWTVLTTAGPGGDWLLRRLLDAPTPRDHARPCCRVAIYSPDPAEAGTLRDKWTPHGGPGVEVCRTPDDAVSLAAGTSHLATDKTYIPFPDFVRRVYATTRVSRVAYAWRMHKSGVVYGGAEVPRRSEGDVLTPRLGRRLEEAGMSLEKFGIKGDGVLWPEFLSSMRSKVPVRPFD